MRVMRAYQSLRDEAVALETFIRLPVGEIMKSADYPDNILQRIIRGVTPGNGPVSILHPFIDSTALQAGQQGVPAGGNGGQAGPGTSPVSADSINAYLDSKHSLMKDTGADFMRLGQQYNLDPRLMVAVAGAESGFGKNLKAGQYNPFGLLYNISDPYNSPYPSWERAINALGKSLTNSRNGYDLSNTGTMYENYCKSGNCDTGLNNINRFMQEQGADSNALTYPVPPDK